MREIVEYLVSKLVPSDSYEIILIEDGDLVEIKVSVDKEEIAKLIGKNGRIVKAIRTIVRQVSGSSRTNVTIEERD